MPVVTPGSKILVTGANGYVAMWVIRTLLEQGYSVRGAVRSNDKGKRLREYFEAYGDKVEWVVVEDITKDGAFDEAVKGVDGIEHIASPALLDGQIDDPEDFIRPAVHGTVGILRSALKAGAQVKRVVLTSSLAAVVTMVTGSSRTFDEKDWGDEFVKTVEEQGRMSPTIVKYAASKTLAEKAAWEFYSKHKTEISWELVALCPPLILGPSLQEVKMPAHLNDSLAMWFNMVFTEIPDSVLKDTHGYVHVKDVAAAHVLALNLEDAAGERMIISSVNYMLISTIGNVIHSLKPEYYTSGVLPRGTPDLETVITSIYNADKSKKILGLEYKSLTEIITDTLADFEARGWLKERYVA
ncbi:D-lactaldehyde dehydrogenase [Flammula alnicola]|nr:D-lactaldehyde dehydrogenase [Flammula alnicola]